MSKRSTDEFWRVTTFALLGLGLLAMVGAIGMVLIVCRFAPKISVLPHDPHDPIHEFFSTMAVVVAALLVFSIFCTAVVVIRYFSHRMRKLQNRHLPTEYVDAWKIAGQRLQAPAAANGDPEEPSDEP